MEQKVGRRIVVQALTQPAEVVRVFLVEENGFQVEPVQQGSVRAGRRSARWPALSRRYFRKTRSTNSWSAGRGYRPRSACSGSTSVVFVFPVALATVVEELDRTGGVGKLFQGELEHDPEGGQQGDDGKGSLHR